MLQIYQISILVTKSAVADYFDGLWKVCVWHPQSVDTNFVRPLRALMTIYVTSPPGKTKLSAKLF